MKLWSNTPSLDALVERFTVGNDRHFDMLLARYDVIGSLAHGEMLRDQELLAEDEWSALRDALHQIGMEIDAGTFEIDDSFEDVHSKIEAELIERVGEAGKKIHTARSRNDQVLLALHLWAGETIEELLGLISSFFDRLLERAEQHRDDLMPGYTHMQIAMPSSFGLWFGAYAEGLVDDVTILKAAQRIADQNPLGSAAGYGSSFPIDRQKTTDLLGMRTLRYNAVGAGLSRGKLEWSVATGLASVAGTLSRLAGDVVLYSGGNFGFFSLPDTFVTGSSIMPHKKNPDLFELVRAHCNLVRSTPEAIATLTTNLAGGYHRDYQLLKELLFPAVTRLTDALILAERAIEGITVHTDWQSEDRYLYLTTVEEVNRLVEEGMPFRDAYMAVAASIQEGTFRPAEQVEHTHIGSIGNLAIEEIRKKFERERSR